MQSLHGKIKALRSVSRERGEATIVRKQEMESNQVPKDRIGRSDQRGSSGVKGLEVGRANEQVTIDILDDSSRQNDGVS
jgi:hypothetical protein